MKTTKPAEGSLCSVCKFGKYEPELVSFSVDRKDKVMLIGDVPGLVCNQCQNKVVDEGISDQLTVKAHAIFKESHCVMFACEFSDLIRDEAMTQVFEIFDQVRVKDDVDTWDLYDEDLEPGMKGTVTGKGVNTFDYIVNFRIGRGKHDVLTLEIDEKDLELVARVGAEKKQVLKSV